MKPTPIGVNDNLSVFGGAAALCCACLPCHARVGFSLLGADQLARDHGEEGRSDSEETIHDEF